MAAQNNNKIVKISKEESESICDLPGSKHQAKAKQESMTKKTLYDFATGSPVATHRGRKLVCHTASAPLPIRMAQSRASPSPQTPKSAPIQMACAFQWPTIQEKAYDKNTSVDPDPFQGSTSGKRSHQGKEEIDRPYESSPTRRSGASKKSHAAYRKLVKRQQDEVNRKTVLPEVCTSKGMNYSSPPQPGKKSVCAQNSTPLPRRSSTFQVVTRKPKSAPVQMAPVFQWPSFQEKSDHVQSMSSKSQGRSVMRYKYVPMQKRRVTFSETERDGCESSPLGKADGTELADVFDSTPTVSSQVMPKVVNRFSQKAMSTQHIARTADVEEQFGKNDVTLITKENKLNVPKYVHDMMRTSSPDSLVAQLIANSKNLTLYDSVESPSLQERKKKAQAERKKFG